MVIGAFQDGEGGPFTLGNIKALGSEAAVSALWKSIVLSGSTALLGGVLGALLSYLIVSMGPRSLIRRTTLAITGVLAQFGGVVLAFAWLSVLGFSGLLTLALKDWPGIDIVGSGWLYGLNGLIVVYTYFQVPLMVLVFTPALEGLRPQLREAAVNLGATSFQYWRMVGIPLAAPGVPGVDAAAVRQRFRGVRHGGDPGQPGQPDRAAPDQGVPHQRDPARPAEPRPSRWPPR